MNRLHDGEYPNQSNRKKKMMKRLIVMAIMASALFASGVVGACDDHVGKCEIEDWRWFKISEVNMLTIEGVASCDSGMISVRIYEGVGDSQKFLSIATGFVEGHTFTAIADNIRDFHPDDIAIRYSIR